MTNRTYSRLNGRYKVTGRRRRYELHFWCDCILGPHWHFVDRAESIRATEWLMVEHGIKTVAS